MVWVNLFHFSSWLLRGVFGLSLLAACNLQVSPALSPPVMASANEVPLRLDRVTKAPTLNFPSPSELNKAAELELSMRLSGYQALGMAVFLPGSPATDYQRLAQLFKAIHAQSHILNDEIFPVLVEKDEFQAYTLGGKEVVFYTGLVRRLTDDALSFVIAHEIAHIAAGHVGETQSRNVINTSDYSDPRVLGDFYSVSNEQEADHLAILYMARAGIDISVAADLWGELAAREDQKQYDIFTASHPSMKDRAAYLDALSLEFNDKINQFDQSRLLDCNPIYCN